MSWTPSQRDTGREMKRLLVLLVNHFKDFPNWEFEDLLWWLAMIPCALVMLGLVAWMAVIDFVFNQ